MTQTTKKRRPRTIHSLAPWIAKDGHIFAADNEEVGVIYRTEAWSSGEKVEHEDQANLCLIAAAPDLLAALRGILADLENTISEPGDDAIADARAAIAKAEGISSNE